MAKKRNYPVEAQKEFDEVASRSSGFTRSESQKKAESEAYNRAKTARDAEKKSGAGRGLTPASSYKRKTKRSSGRD